MKPANRPPYIPYPLGRRRFLALVSGGLLAAPFTAEAQQAGRVYRIGFLRAGRPPDGFVAGFKQGLQELGYVEGRPKGADAAEEKG